MAKLHLAPRTAVVTRRDDRIFQTAHVSIELCRRNWEMSIDITKTTPVGFRYVHKVRVIHH